MGQGNQNWDEHVKPNEKSQAQWKIPLCKVLKILLNSIQLSPPTPQKKTDQWTISGNNRGENSVPFSLQWQSCATWQTKLALSPLLYEYQNGGGRWNGNSWNYLTCKLCVCTCDRQCPCIMLSSHESPKPKQGKSKTRKHTHTYGWQIRIRKIKQASDGNHHCVYLFFVDYITRLIQTRTCVLILTSLVEALERVRTRVVVVVMHPSLQHNVRNIMVTEVRTDAQLPWWLNGTYSSNTFCSCCQFLLWKGHSIVYWTKLLF